jgi:hypothetical protein
MTRLDLSLSAFELIAVTRVALGLGLGLLLARRLEDHTRTRLGASLLAIGAASTIPALIAVRRARTS